MLASALSDRTLEASQYRRLNNGSHYSLEVPLLYNGARKCYSSYEGPDIMARFRTPGTKGSLHIRQMVGFFRKDEDREEALVMFWPRRWWERENSMILAHLR